MTWLTTVRKFDLRQCRQRAAFAGLLAMTLGVALYATVLANGLMAVGVPECRAPRTRQVQEEAS